MDKLLREKEVASWLNWSIQTLRNDRSLGRGLPYLKIRRSVRYSAQDIEDYLAEHRIDTTIEDSGVEN